ncbi:MAG: hypothetical protein GY807_01690, partial [Gammaproteobacteria bacterium]|nr:hypothetical protein [Gammaproteobacteria bacterium]
LATRPYEPVYARLKGEFVDRPATGFAADYDGTFEVHQILSVSREKIAACHTQPMSANSESTVNSEAKTYVFVCEDKSAYTVRATETETWLFRPEGTLKLSSVPAEDGAKYSDGSFKLWIKGQQAELGEIGGTRKSCRNDRRRAIWEKAKLEGADFRAVGNEPGWNLEIREGRRIVLVTDYGASRIELALPEPMVDTEARTTRWNAGELTLEVIGRPCRDSMSGEPFEARVVVTWQGKMLRGCGRALH